MKTILALAAGFLLAWATQPMPAPSTSQPTAQTPAPQTSTQTVPPGSTNPNSTPPNLLPAGTELVIRTNEDIDATSADIGHEYAGEMAREVVDQSGLVVIPRATPIHLTFVNAGSGALNLGTNQVELALRSLQLNGRTYRVQSNTVLELSKSGLGENKRTAETTGGGALLGTLVGATAGGGKGAAAQVLTRGSEVKIPAESVLTFKLDRPMTLR